MSPFDYQLFYQRHLPHYQPPGATLFITFRLAGSLPVEVIQRLEVELRVLERQIQQIGDASLRQQEIYKARTQLFGQWDGELDAARHGPAWLSDPAIAQLVVESIRYRDGRVYTLDACCVMPNHVHLVCTPLPNESGQEHPLSAIMHSLKGYTARKANLLLGREGDFWQHESYDHVVRDAAELRRIVAYVIENPVRAGLPTTWTYCRTNC